MLNDGLLGKVSRLFCKNSIANTAITIGFLSCNVRLVAYSAFKPYKFGIGSKCDVLYSGDTGRMKRPVRGS